MRKSVNGKRRSGLTGESVITLPDSVKNVKNWKKSGDKIAGRRQTTLCTRTVNT